MARAAMGGKVPVTRDRVTRLREFGLSEYAARAYIALLDLGTTEARDVSSLSKVPASKIYHILDQLHEKGLVEILPEFPRKYAPVPFAEFLDKIQAEHEEASRRMREERDELLETFALVGGATASDRGSLTFLRGRRNAFERFDEVVRNAREDALLVATHGMLANRRGWVTPLAEAAARGVRLRVLAPDAESAAALADLGPGALVRPRDLAGRAETASILLVDQRRALLMHFLPDDGHTTEGNASAVYVDQDGVVGLLAGLAETSWQQAAAPPAGIPIAGRTPVAGVEVPLRE
jgi:HTH-type transcriptional regulator, sugar sensing transcriptional regulator